MKITQKDRIINYIREFGSISTKEAFDDLGIARLGARIFELKQEGYNFTEKWEESKNRFGEQTSYKRFYLVDMVSEKQITQIKKFMKDFDTENLSKMQASQILNRLFCR